MPTPLFLNAQRPTPNIFPSSDTFLPQHPNSSKTCTFPADRPCASRRYRAFPGWVKIVLIRKVTDISAVGIEGKNEPARFEKAFEGLPREAWHVFEDPSECTRLIQDAVRRG